MLDHAHRKGRRYRCRPDREAEDTPRQAARRGCEAMPQSSRLDARPWAVDLLIAATTVAANLSPLHT